MNKFKRVMWFAWVYLKVAPVWAWFLFWAIPRLYKEFPHDQTEKGIHALSVFVVSYFGSREAYRDCYVGSIQGAYIKARVKALEVGMNTHPDLGVSYGVKVINGNEGENSI